MTLLSVVRRLLSAIRRGPLEAEQWMRHFFTDGWYKTKMLADFFSFSITTSREVTRATNVARAP